MVSAGVLGGVVGGVMGSVAALWVVLWPVGVSRRCGWCCGSVSGWCCELVGVSGEVGGGVLGWGSGWWCG